MIVVQVFCDGCSAGGSTTTEWKAHKIRAKLTGWGWRVNAKGGKDYCPQCVKKGIDKVQSTADKA